MRYIAFVLALLLGGCATAPPESCDVQIGPSQYEYLSGQLVGESNGGATLLSPDFSKLWDGRPSTPTRFQYNTSGTQTTASKWGIQIQLAQQGEDTPDSVTVGVVIIKKTNMPPGAVVQIMPTNISDAPIGFGSMQLDESGVTTGACIIFTNQAVGPVVVTFPNNDGSGGQYLSNGEDIEIGEIRVSETFEFELKRTVEWGWATINRQRFTSNGQSFPVLQPKVRTLSVDFAPIAEREAINDGTDDLMTVLGKCMDGNVACFVFSEVEDPALYQSSRSAYSNPNAQKLRAKTAIIGNFSQAPNIVNGGDKYWGGRAAITEST